MPRVPFVRIYAREEEEEEEGKKRGDVTLALRVAVVVATPNSLT